MTVIQGMLDKAATILSADGVFKARRQTNQIIIDVLVHDVSNAFILATTTFEDNGVTPMPVTIFRPISTSTSFFLMVDPQYGVSFRVEIPNAPNPDVGCVTQ